MSQQPDVARRGFSLVELLVVIGVIGVLLCLLLPAVQRVRETAARAACANNLRQLGTALHHYHDVFGTLPPDMIVRDYNGPGGHHTYALQWPALILPYIEQGPVFQQMLEAYRITWEPWLNPPHTGLATVVRSFVCPSDARLSQPITDDVRLTAAYASYVGVSGSVMADGAMGGRQSGDIWLSGGIRIADITDGTSTTLLAGESPPLGFHLLGCWYSNSSPSTGWGPHDRGYGGAMTMSAYWPKDTSECSGPFQFGPGSLQNPCDSNHFWSLHSGGANFVFCDGSVHFLAYSAAPLMPALASRAGGEAVAVP